MAQVASTRRSRPEIVRAAIAELCSGQARRPSELAELLNRQATTIQEHVKAMLADGALELGIPDQPNHPKQTYRTVAREEAPRA